MISSGNIWAAQRPLRFKKTPKGSNKSAENREIIIVNFFVLGGYTFLSALGGNIAPLIEVIFLAIHVLICFILAIVTWKRIWVLCGAFMLIVGFFACLAVLWQFS